MPKHALFGEHRTRNQYLLWYKLAEAGQEYHVHTHDPNKHNTSSLRKLVPFLNGLRNQEAVP